jgi:hypothetical protein
MKRLATILLTLGVLFKAIGSDKEKSQIEVALNNSSGGGFEYLVAQPLAHRSGSLEARMSGVLTSVIEYDYTVDNQVKFIDARFIIHLPKADNNTRSPVIVCKRFPIDTSKANIPVLLGYSGYALLIK